MTDAPPNIDALLAPLLSVGDDRRADELIANLIATHAEPVIKGIIRYKLHFNSSQKTELEDLTQDVLLQLLAQLSRFRRNPESNPIGDLRGIAAVIAHRTCSQWMRKQFPQRHAFKNRLHYLLTRQRGLAIWTGTDGKQIAGFEVWQGKEAAPIHSDQLARNNDLRTQLNSVSNGNQQEFATSVATILSLVGAPVEFDELVGVMASLLGVKDHENESLESDNEDSNFEPSSPEPDQAWKLEKRSFLTRLWEELLQLPVNQRVALLLNLKDANGNGCIGLLPITGVASLREIATGLEIPVEKFATLWNDLPLEDARIAELLGLTRQQIINARKSGRERLARRLKGFF